MFHVKQPIGLVDNELNMVKTAAYLITIYQQFTNNLILLVDDNKRHSEILVMLHLTLSGKV